MSLVDRWDEESQNVETMEGENTGTPYPEQNDDSWSNVWMILKIVWVVVVIIVIIWIILYPKISNFGSLYIDNPTDDEITVTIWDKDPITIAPKSHEEIDLKPGTYPLTVNWLEVWEFKKWAMDWKAFLNPTKSIYVEEIAAYMYNTSAENPLDYYDLVINEEEYWGPFVVHEDYYITGAWEYGLDEKLPEEITTYTSYDNDSYAIRKTIHRYDEFVKVYDEEYLPYYE